MIYRATRQVYNVRLSGKASGALPCLPRLRLSGAGPRLNPRLYPSGTTIYCLLIPVCCILILSLSFPAYTADVSFQAYVDKNKIGTTDRLKLIVSVSGSKLGSLPNPVLPSLNDFAVSVPRRSSSSSYQFSTGGSAVSAQKLEFTYHLRPRRSGNLVIGPVKMEVKGVEYETRPIQIQVVEGTTETVRTPRGSQIPIEGNLYMEVTADRQRAYVGEQITLIYDLYNRFSISDLRYNAAPAYQDFWVEDIFDFRTKSHLESRREAIDNRLFEVALLKKVAVFPKAPGTFRIEPLKIECDIQVRGGSRSIFDFGGFSTRTKTFLVQSDPISVEVLPLPQRGKPGDFDVPVGDFSISASTDLKTATKGDAISLRVVISGAGNVTSIRELKPPLLDSFKVYDPKIEAESKAVDGIIQGTKTFEYVLIPETDGDLLIAPFEFSYFDPAKERYITTQTSPLSLRISPVLETEKVSAGYGLSREEIKLVGEDIRYIKPDYRGAERQLEDQGRPLYKDMRFLFLQIVPVITLIGAWTYKRHLVKVRTDAAYVRRKRAKTQAARRLKRARQLMKDESSAEFYAEINSALSEFLADKLNIPAAGLTKDSMEEHLLQRGVDQALVDNLKDTLIRCDFARFAPSQSMSDDLETLLNKTEKSIDRLEKRI